jgi:hypothetical protein
MIRKIKSEEIPICVEVIKKSFLTVADEYGFTEENAPRFTAFATTQDRLYWHMDGEHRPMYVFEEDENSTLEKVSGSLKRTNNRLVNDYKLKLSGLYTEI